jgi:protein tyrosine phosphatase (PTP) superfamily phosphohydrolase (DUF442 family)
MSRRLAAKCTRLFPSDSSVEARNFEHSGVVRRSLDARNPPIRNIFMFVTITYETIRAICTLCVGISMLVPSGCGGQSAGPPLNERADTSRTAELATVAPHANEAAAAAPERLEAPHLPNAFRLNAKVISGGLPDGEEAFCELAALGVKTVISVDGAKPQVDLAKRYGLRYVHLPHGYDGISDERTKELAVAVRQLFGPVYIHCHHGKHRSPAAAAVACVATGLLRPHDALGVLKAAGTSENYRGLYQSATGARRIDDRLLDEAKIEFREVADLPALAEAMVALEHTHDHLKGIAQAGWKATADHPDLDPAHEALLLREHFTELLRDERPEAFRQLLRDSETAAGKLETILRRGSGSTPDADRLFETVTKNCTACHRTFRDVPLSEKAGR